MGDGVAQGAEGQFAVARADNAGNRARHLNLGCESGHLGEFEHERLGLPRRVEAVFDAAADEAGGEERGVAGAQQVAVSPDALDVPVQVDRRGAGKLFEAPPRTAFRRILSVRTGSVQTGRVRIPRVPIPRFSLRRAHGNVSHADADHAPAREVVKPGGVGLLVAAVARRLAAVAQPHFRIVGRREDFALDHPSVKAIGNPGRRAASPIGNGVKRPIRSRVARQIRSRAKRPIQSRVAQPARNRAKRLIRSHVGCFDLPVAQHPRSASGRQHVAELADEFRKQRVAFASAVAICANAVRAGGFRRDDERRIRDDDVVPFARGAQRIRGIHGIRRVRPWTAHGLQQRTAPEVDLRPREGRVESRVAERAGGNVGSRHPRAA